MKWKDYAEAWRTLPYPNHPLMVYETRDTDIICYRCNKQIKKGMPSLKIIYGVPYRYPSNRNLCHSCGLVALNESYKVRRQLYKHDIETIERLKQEVEHKQDLINAVNL